MGRFYRMIFGLLAMGSMSMAQAQYCPLSGLCDDFVESLTCNNLTYAGTAGQCITTGGYEYLNDTIYLDPAQPTTIDITIGTNLDTRVVGWFDADNDEVFDAQERIEFLTTAVLGMHTGLLAASPVAADTVTRLRIVLYLAGDVIDPCNGATLFGVYQVIDIPVRITSDPAPSNPSTPAYCAASGDCGAAGAAAITNVTLIGDANTSINNNSGCDNYGDYTNLQATVSAGQTYDISIAGGNNLLGIAGVYVDWNDNGSFDDPGEFFAGVNAQPPYAAVIIPPLVGTTGLKRMRVRTTALANTPDACGALDLGEVEDYTLYYVNPNAPLPLCIDENTSFPQDSATTCQSFIFRWSPVTEAMGYRFSLIDGMSALVNEVSLTDTTYQFSTPLTIGRTYRWVVVPFNDNGNALGCDTLTFFVAPNADPTVSILPADSIDVCRGVDLALDGNPQNGTPAFTHLWTALNGGVLDATNAQQVLFTGSNPLGTYRFSYLATDANGCSASDTVLINVQPPASAGSANAQPGQICSGQTTNFQVSNSIGTISWESGPTAAGPWTTALLTDNGMGLFTTDVLTADIYFRYTATLGVCSETSSALFIEVLPIPAKPIVLADSLVGCEGNGIVLRTVNYSEDIVWNDDQPTVNDSLEVFQTGFYVATTTGLCPSASDSVFVTINPSPQKPSVAALGGSTKCDNEAFTLISSAVGNNIWSTGETTDTIVFVSDGAVTVAQVNAFGCQTQSDTLFLSYIPRPAKPGISLLSTGLLCEGSPVQLAADTSGSLTWSTGDITDTIEVSSSGAYTVSFRGANGCDAVSDTFNLNLLPTPAKPQISPSGPACQGTPLVLYSDYTGVNTWSDGSTADSLFISANGDYSVTVLGANGCTSTSDLFTVLFATPPAKPVISQIADTLFASGNAASYQWFNPNGPIPGAVDRAFVPGTRDLYAVVAISPEGCVSPLSDPLLFSGVGIDELILSDLLIYPNPSQGRFQVDLKGQLADQLKLMDVTGKIVYQQPIQGSNVTLQVPLQSGLYFLSFQRDGRWSKAYKITIQ